MFRSAGHGGEPNDSASGVVVERAVGRPCIRGKFLWRGQSKLWVRGVTYGTFRPAADGCEFPDPALVERDFAAMAASGLNAVRTYTVPPRWVLDTADRHGLLVMIGVPWEQHVAFLDDPARVRSIEARVRAGVRACAGHPAVLCYAIGNEIPAPIVRWHGPRRIERMLARLYRAAKAEDPTALVTYVNFPTTEYLDLPFLDLVCFNVYLENRDRLEAYLARLHNLAGDRPLLMAEIGLDSRRHGEATQARVLDAQLCTAYASGCAGAFVFAWTDDWHRGGHDIMDWDFGLLQRDRRPKRALAAVRRAVAELPFPKDRPWPRVSVVVCSYNGARTISDCLEGAMGLEYPDFEVIVVDDGSTDATAAIARQFGARVISTPNQGLSAARNVGWKAATGEIVAYIDDDARPDPHWLTYLAAEFLRTTHAAVGGPNIPPPGDGTVAECVANAPGGPIHVLVADREAEHIPGCNMAFRKSCLEAIGGFDPRFRTAGDDVDVCWRLQARGWTLGFSAPAMVWHHRRNSVRAYWRQQIGYGRAEALLERKWPERYNAAGHLRWTGRLYGRGLAAALSWRRTRIYHGPWGRALFQSLYHPAPGVIASLPLMPEWYLLILVLAVLSATGVLWPPLLVAVPLFGLAVAAPVVQALASARRAVFAGPAGSPVAEARRRALVSVLHLLQPLARLHGRLLHGLTPWRWSARAEFRWPGPRTVTQWSERWQDPAARLAAVEASSRATGAVVVRGGDFDAWDLQVRGGALGAARVLLAVEEHGGGRQLARFRTWGRPSAVGLALVAGVGALAVTAAAMGAAAAAALLGTAAVGLAARIVFDCAAATAALLAALPSAEMMAAHPAPSRHAAVTAAPRTAGDRAA